MYTSNLFKGINVVDSKGTLRDYQVRKYEEYKINQSKEVPELLRLRKIQQVWDWDWDDEEMIDFRDS